MTLAQEGDLSEEQSRSIAALIREELARRRISRRFLADRARISISTLEKALSGRRSFTLATTIRLEEALGVSLRGKEPPPPPVAAAVVNALAPAALGFYARPAVSWIEGAYLTLRPSFGEKTAIYAYRTQIGWDAPSSTLTFRESERVDAAFTQDGSVSIPHQSGHIHLVTNRQGQYRLITVSRPTIAGEMYGILSTLQAGRGSHLMPVAAPIAFVPVGNLPQAQFGRIPSDHACYPLYREHLARVTQDDFALFMA